MNNRENSRLAKEMAEFCRERVMQKSLLPTRLGKYKRILQSVTVALLAMSAMAAGDPNRFSKW